MTPTPPTIGRRKALKGFAASLGIAGGGLGYLALANDEAQAAVTTSMSLPTGGAADEDGHAIPFLNVSGDWSYSGVTVDPTDWVVSVYVSENGTNWDPLGTDNGVPFGFDEANTYQVFAPLTAAANFSSGDFQAPDTESIGVDVWARAELEVLNGDEVVVSAQASDSSTLTIEDTTEPGTANVSGSGSWEWQMDESDPTPSPP